MSGEVSWLSSSLGHCGLHSLVLVGWIGGEQGEEGRLEQLLSGVDDLQGRTKAQGTGHPPIIGPHTAGGGHNGRQLNGRHVGAGARAVRLHLSSSSRLDLTCTVLVIESRQRAPTRPRQGQPHFSSPHISLSLPARVASMHLLLSRLSLPTCECGLLCI